MLAVDPTSPFSGGAILGDRVRMQHHTTDPGVFIRSMATRGHLGGLALATPQAVRVLDAVGKPWIVIETVGVGQVEVEIAGHADTTVVVVNPGWGDAVQAAKAGLLEIADIFVVNKADRPGADATVSDLAGMLELSARPRVAAADRAHGRDRRATASTSCATRSARTARTSSRPARSTTRRRARLRGRAPRARRRAAARARRRRAEGAQFDALVDDVAARATRSVHRGRRAARRRRERASARACCSTTRRAAGSRRRRAGRRGAVAGPGRADAIVGVHRALRARGRHRRRRGRGARAAPASFSVPMSPAVARVARRTARVSSRRRSTRCSCAIGTGAGAPPWLRRDRRPRPPTRRRGAALPHRSTRVCDRRRRRRARIVGRGLCGRWEIGFEVAPGQRGRGLGRRLVAAGARPRARGRAGVGAGRAGQRRVAALDARGRLRARSAPRCSSRATRVASRRHDRSRAHRTPRRRRRAAAPRTARR